MNQEGAAEVTKQTELHESMELEVERLTEKIEEFWTGMTPTEASHQLQCQLYRNEEINLYYQCTQNAFNNFALDHFGGDQRSYPRWLSEVYRCNVELSEAEIHTIIDEEHEDKEFKCETETAHTLPMPMPFVYHSGAVAKLDRATLGSQHAEHNTALE